MNDGYPSRAPQTAGSILASLGLGSMAAGALAVAASATAFAPLAHPAATGRLLVSGAASAIAWSDAGLSYASSVLTIAGSVPGTPSSGQVAIGGGVVKAGTAVYGADGSAAAPGVRTTTYAHGMYSAAASILGFTVGGVASLQISQPAGGLGSGFRLLTAADADYCYFLTDRPNAELRLSAGNTTTNGANIRLLGSGHATPSVGYLRVSAAASLSWSATDVISGLPLTVVNGTAASPGLKTSENHGLYRYSASVFGISVAGASAIRLYGPTGSSFGGVLMFDGTTASQPGVICNALATTHTILGGGSTINVGGQVKVYGETHATKASYIEFVRTTTVSAYFDGSGVLTLSSTTSAGVAAGALVCSGGGYFAKAVFSNNDASGVHYYGNSGLTMRDVGTGTSTYLDLAFGSASHGAYNIRSSNAATVRFNIDTSGHVTLGGTAGNYLNINNATGELRINGTKVSGPRDTGWTAMTGTTDKATAYDTATVTLPQLAGRVMALQAALTAHGKIGT